MDHKELTQRVKNAAFAFRGYNIANLGRSHEMLTHAVYGPFYEEALRMASQVCADHTIRHVDLVQRVREQRESTLHLYAEDITLIVAVERAQLRILKELFGIEIPQARLAFGYSLGEISALIATGVMSFDEAMMIPLSLAEDCVALAEDVTLGVLFSRGRPLPMDAVQRLSLRINQRGEGVMGTSAILSPNSLLLMGQQQTLHRFSEAMAEQISPDLHLRMNSNRWPPLHTPIVWEKNIPNRAAMLMHTLPGGFTAPNPPVVSLVTGKATYNDYNCRELLRTWTDHPQRLWDAVYETLSLGIETVIHLGPEPNIVPATFKRLRENVEMQTRGVGMRALQTMVRRPWLKYVLPDRTALLRAPDVRHVILEDWLLEHPPE